MHHVLLLVASLCFYCDAYEAKVTKLTKDSADWTKPNAQQLAQFLLHLSPARILQASSRRGVVSQSFQDRLGQLTSRRDSPVMQGVTSTPLKTGTASSFSLDVDGKTITFETGRIGRQASGAVTASMGGTTVYSTACFSRDVSDRDFVPLTVDWFARFSAAGKTCGAFHRRDSRGDDTEILVARLIDRPLRPMIRDGWSHETQLVTHVLSYDSTNALEPLSICAASAAMAISEVPMLKPIAGVEVGLVDGILTVNPTRQEKEKSTLSLIMSGTKDNILMIEGEADFLPDDMMAEALALGHVAIGKICDAISEFASIAGKPKKTDTLRYFPSTLVDEIDEEFGMEIEKSLQIADKQQRGKAKGVIDDKVMEKFGQSDADTEEVVLQDDDDSAIIVDEEGSPISKSNSSIASIPMIKSYTSMEIKKALKKLSTRRLRQMILLSGKRPDGRGIEDVRPISIEHGFLSVPHGSVLFTRGETQTIATTTLGGKSMAAKYENLDEFSSKDFYLQYRFPPSSIGEVGRVGGVNRREVGHGNLAERALRHALPDRSEFPYTVRTESLVTESSGSSSMATVCGCCLAMLDAGVPLKTHVAGVAMGLILGDTEEDEEVILTDILGLEDALGTMDFKVAGDERGITSFQLDIKSEGLSLTTLKKAIDQARRARLHVLGVMRDAIPTVAKMNAQIPRLLEFTVSPTFIGKIIGPKGTMIQKIQESNNVTVNVEEVEGLGYVQIESLSDENIEAAKKMVLAITSAVEPEIGKTYYGCRIASILSFGMFVEVTPGCEGLLHISQITAGHLESMENAGFVEGDLIDVKVVDKDDKGKLRLSRLDLLGVEAPAIDLGVEAPAKAPPPEIGETYRDCKVMSVKDYGLFVEVTPGNQALLHISQITAGHLESIKNAGFVEGDLIDVKVVGKDDKGKLQLSRLDLLDVEAPVKAPPPEIGETYRDCKVMNVKNYGLFVEVTPGNQALLHISRITAGRLESIEDAGLVEGDLIDVEVMGADRKGRLEIRRLDLDGQKTG